MACCGEWMATAAPVEPDLAGVGGRQPEQHARQFRAAGADQSRQTENFAGPQLETDAPHAGSGAADILQRQHHVARRRLGRRVKLGDFAADDELDQAGLIHRLATRWVPTLAPSRSTVTRSASAKNLLQSVRDVDDTHAGRAQLSHDGE